MLKFVINFSSHFSKSISGFLSEVPPGSLRRFPSGILPEQISEIRPIFSSESQTGISLAVASGVTTGIKYFFFLFLQDYLWNSYISFLDSFKSFCWIPSKIVIEISPGFPTVILSTISLEILRSFLFFFFENLSEVQSGIPY